MSLTDEDKQWLEQRFEQTIEAVRGMQTEILRGFHAHSDGLTIRLRKIEADSSNLDAALSGRIEVLERRLLEIEMKLDHTK